jgi:branched-chain amino acid transport system ATP-binding protein
MMAVDGSPLLEVRDVERRFGGVKALNKMNLTLRAGEAAALIGPNGSGKSTLVNVISRMVDVDAGHVRIGGVDVTREHAHRVTARGVARTFQHVRLVPELTLRENVASGAVHRDLDRTGGRLLSWWRGTTPRTNRHEIESALDMMLVPASVRDKTPDQVSYAVQRHTEVARALVSKPQMLLLDEPVAGMNPTEVATFLGLMRDINSGGIATLLIDHNIEFVMKAATTITVINRGEQIASGPVDVVRKDPVVIEAYLGSRRSSASDAP